MGHSRETIYNNFMFAIKNIKIENDWGGKALVPSLLHHMRSQGVPQGSVFWLHLFKFPLRLENWFWV